jgi:hypothetical protein
MSNERFFLNATWFDRQEGPRSCAERMARMLKTLSAGHADLAEWFHGYVAPIALGFSEPDITDIAEIFSRGVSRRDDNGERFPGSGYSLDTYNNLNDNARSVTMYVASGNWKLGPRNNRQNKVFLKLPLRRAGKENLLTTPTLFPVLSAIICAWEPEYAVLGSSEIAQHFRESENGPGPRLPFGNWMVYLSAPLAALFSPPHDAIVKQLPGFGIVILATEEPFTVSNPEHVRACVAIQQALEPVRAFLDGDERV